MLDLFIVADCVCEGGQAVIAGFQAHAGRDHQFSATRPTNHVVLGHVSRDRRRVHCKILTCRRFHLYVNEQFRSRAVMPVCVRVKFYTGRNCSAAPERTDFNKFLCDDYVEAV